MKANSSTYNRPLVSVLMPAYNHEKFIEDSVRSVWAQTYKNVELIVVNDGSTDQTLEILMYLREISPIPMFLDSHRNQGICRTLNKCFTMSHGYWIAFLASDDKYKPNFLERMLEEASRIGNDQQVLHCDAVMIDEFNNEGTRVSHIRRIPPIEGESFFTIANGQGFIVSGTLFLSRKLMEVVGPFDERLKAEDFDFHLRLARFARFLYIDEPLYISRRVVGSFGSRRKVWSNDIFTALAKHKDYLGLQYNEVLVNRNIKLSIDFFEDGDFCNAKQHLRKAVELTPSAKSIATLLSILKMWIIATPKLLIKIILKIILPNRLYQLMRQKYWNLVKRKKKRQNCYILSDLNKHINK